jgi:AcrR family transcriptional regulator
VESAAAARRQDQIVEAARALFVRHGYRKTSMSDIAVRAGLAKRTLYLHFESKEAIFRALLDTCQRQVRTRASVAEHLDAPVHQRVADLLYAYLGTSLEWFADPEHLGEIEQLVLGDPITFGDRSMCDELIGRVASMMLACVTASTALDARDAHERAVVAVLAASGAKSFHDATVDNMRERVELIARRVCVGLEW